MGGELLSFDEALAELQMATHELRSLVAQGEIRAFRDEDSLKFRRTDILDLKRTRETQPEGITIEPEELAAEKVEPLGAEDLTPGPEVKSVKHETEETELLTGIGQGAGDFLGLDETAGEEADTEDTAQTVVPTIEISDEDMIEDTAQTVIPTVSAGDETDVIGAEEAEVLPIAPSLLGEEEGATEMATEEVAGETAVAGVAEDAAETAEAPLRFQDAGAEELGVSTAEVEEEAEEAVGVTAPRRAQKYQEELAAAPAISPVFLVFVIATFVFLLFALPVFYGIATDSAPSFEPYKGLFKFLAEKTVVK